jgi:N-acetylneuraminic acid mutarotase
MTSPTIPLALALLLSATTAHAQFWQERADIPGPGRHHPVTFTLDGYGYVVTGTTTAESASDDFFRYDPVDDSWEVLPDFPGPNRSYSYGGAYGGKAYLGFGLGATYLADLWEYDPVTEDWTQLATCPGQPRTHPAFVITDDGKIYVACGGSSVGNLRDLWEYDIATNVWIQRDDLPGPNRHHPYYFNVGDVPYVAFGHGGGIFRDVYRFDPVLHTWSRMDDFPGEARVAGTQFSYDGHGYVLSGDGSDHGHLDEGEFWRYNHESDTWTELPPHPGSSRWAPGTFLVGDELYFLGGLSSIQLENTMWSYTMGPVVDVADAVVTPAAITLGAPRPNPFQTGTTLSFDLPSSVVVKTSVIDAAGRSVRFLGSRSWPAGAHHVVWDGRSDRGDLVSPGVYFVRLTTPDETVSERLVRVP